MAPVTREGLYSKHVESPFSYPSLDDYLVIIPKKEIQS